MNKEFFEAVQMLEKEKGIPAEYLYEKIQNAIIVALRKDYNGKDVVSCEIDPENYEMNVFVRKNVVDEIDDEDTDITVADAQQYKPGAEAGEAMKCTRWCCGGISGSSATMLPGAGATMRTAPITSESKPNWPFAPVK